MANPRWHQVRDAVARITARVREIDRSPRMVDGVRRVRRALPGDSGFGDPLSAAGRDSAGTVARVAGVLFDEQPTASRELTLSGLQVWQALLERAGGGSGDAEVTLVFTDIVGFSDWALRAGDEETLRLLRAVSSATEPHVRRHRGHVVKRLGDGMMAVFPDPQLAFDAVLDCLAGLEEVEVGGWTPRIRVGIHTGRPRALGGDYLGVDVNIAARLAERAGAGEILVSGPAMERLDRSRVEPRRKRSFWTKRVKGVPEGIEIYTASPR